MVYAYVLGAACPAYNADKFRQGKLKLLKDFDITLTESERETFDTLQLPREIENFVRDIIKNRLQ